jgi:hypothetical protein
MRMSDKKISELSEENFIKLNRPTYYIAKYTDEDLRAAILIERLACAKLCDDAALYFVDQGMNASEGAEYCANEILRKT